MATSKYSRTGKIGMAELINNYVPNDGVLIIFNGDWPNVRKFASEVGGGMLSVNVADDPRKPNMRGRGIRDLFVFIKENDDEA